MPRSAIASILVNNAASTAGSVYSRHRVREGSLTGESMGPYTKLIECSPQVDRTQLQHHLPQSSSHRLVPSRIDPIPEPVVDNSPSFHALDMSANSFHAALADTRPSPSINRIDHFTPPDMTGLPALASAASSRRLSFAPTNLGDSPLDAATTETLERQPRLASGYEWDERHHSVNRGQDGTACLSVEPDGDGYLGESASASHYISAHH